MLYKILRLIVAEDTFNIFENYPSNYNLSHIVNKEFKTVEELEGALLSFFTSMLDMEVNSFYYNEALRMKKFTARVFKRLEMQKDTDTDHTDQMIDIYAETADEYRELPLVSEHIDFILK